MYFITCNEFNFMHFPASLEKDDLEMSYYRNCGMQKCWCNFPSDVGIPDYIPIFPKFIEIFQVYEVILEY